MMASIIHFFGVIKYKKLKYLRITQNSRCTINVIKLKIGSSYQNSAFTSCNMTVKYLKKWN